MPPSSRDQVEAFKERITSRVGTLRCPVHGQPPRLRFQGATLREIDIRMSGCCDQLIVLANQKIIQV